MQAQEPGSWQPEEIECIRRVVDTIPGLVWSAGPDGAAEFLNKRWLDYTGLAHEQAVEFGWKTVMHPDDLPSLIGAFVKANEARESFSIESRIRRFDGVYRWFLMQGSPLCDDSGKLVQWYGTNTDIEDRKRAEEILRTSEGSLRQTLDSIPGLVCTMSPAGEIEFVNRQMTDYFGRDLESIGDWATNDIFHPDDLARAIEVWSEAVRTGEPTDVEQRLRRADGLYRWFRIRMLPLRDELGRVIRWNCLLADIDERKQAEMMLRRSERCLAEAQRLARCGSWSWNVSTREALWSQELFRILGLDPETTKASKEIFFERLHPDDRARMQRVVREEEAEPKAAHPSDYRILLPDGTTKHLHSVANPVTDDSGNVVEVIGTSLDVTEQVLARESLEKAFAQIKLLKDQLFQENLALREEVDRTAMFEEIIGNSRPLQTVLSRVTKVAPTDSTVLITGETGTGKELIARAIHRQSQRSQNAFVSVNCSALAPSLILSELFGHEKGAFTGAVQRRLGRFELANSGTIFLDEVGDLPLDTQVALLRVLQEREFERVGGKQPIHVDVRVIAATNRNLVAAMANGTMRQDLFYRLNVFPIELPPLRQRKDDILVLLEYFVHRFAKKAGKHFKGIDHRTLDMLQSYSWPGNVRELQNVVERSVIVSSDEVFRVDEAWLTSNQGVPSTVVATGLPDGDSGYERKIIEDALRASRGRVSGPKGAAVRLNLPPSTLDAMIKRLKIQKSRYKLA
jgi:PAS domain S-box-containing protein